MFVVVQCLVNQVVDQLWLKVRRPPVLPISEFLMLPPLLPIHPVKGGFAPDSLSEHPVPFLSFLQKM